MKLPVVSAWCVFALCQQLTDPTGHKFEYSQFNLWTKVTDVPMGQITFMRTCSTKVIHKIILMF